MNRTDAIRWVLTVCAPYLRLSQAKTLSQLVAAGMSCLRISMPALGRAMPGRVKHQSKKCWRFCANDRIEVSDAMRGVIAQLLRKHKKPLLVSFDWTDIRSFATLIASAVVRGRSIPLLWASCTRYVYEGHRSRNAFEESLLLLLRGLVPARLRGGGGGRQRFDHRGEFDKETQTMKRAKKRMGSGRKTRLGYTRAAA